MAERQFVKVVKEERVAVVTIDHPPVNALNSATMKDLEGVLDELKTDAKVKAVVITGAGEFAFIAGADVNEIAAVKSKEEGVKAASEGQAIISKIENLGKPVIAAINAVCLGGGNELAMACHIRVASDRARFGQPEMNLGIIPGFGGTQRLPRIVGLAKATELILTGDMISAQDALKIGLVNKVVPSGEVLKQAKDLAKKIASKAGMAVIAAMKAIDESRKVGIEEGLAKEAEYFGDICETEDKKEGIAAFLEKRQPKFGDR